MAHKSYHVIPAPKGGWSVKKEGSHRATKHFDTKAPAVNWARGLSKNQNVKLYIHGKDGMIYDRESYGKDPLPPQN